MIPAPFEYHRPGSVGEAVAILGEHGDEARPLAGGHSLIPMMKLRMAAPSHLVDLRDIDELRGIEERDGKLVLGAMTTQADLLASRTVARVCPIIVETAALIADPQVRYVGTIGGNVANGDPGNDMPAIMMCLGATYRIAGQDGERTVAARDFYEGAYFTALEDGELLTAIEIPTPAAGHGSAYEKLKRKTGDYATAGAAVVLSMAGGSCTGASVALTNVGQTAILVEASASALVGTSVDEAAVQAAAAAAGEAADPVEDLRGGVEFRRAMAAEMTARAVRRARRAAD